MPGAHGPECGCKHEAELKGGEFLLPYICTDGIRGLNEQVGATLGGTFAPDLLPSRFASTPEMWCICWGSMGPGGPPPASVGPALAGNRPLPAVPLIDDLFNPFSFAAQYASSIAGGAPQLLTRNRIPAGL